MSNSPRNLAVVIMVLAATIGADAAWAQNWPSKPIRLISPFPPGGAVDQVARALAIKLEALGQPVVVDNRAGASGIIGMEACARAEGDGHTLCLTNNDSVTFNAYLFKKLPFDPARDLVPVVHAGFIEALLVGRAGAPASMNQVVLDLKSRPNSLSLGSFGPGTIGHLYAEYLAKESGARLLHVPFKGAGPAMQAVLGGQVDIVLTGVGPSVPLIRAGKIKALVVLGKQRSKFLPDTPTFREIGLQFEVQPWLGLFGPRALPAEIVQRISTQINRAVKEDAAFVDRTYTQQAIEFWPNTPEQFAKFFEQDLQLAEKLVKDAGVVLD